MPETARAPWPARAVIDGEGLRFGGVPATSLVRRFGTPLLLVDPEEIRDRCRRARASFPRTCYAVKALTARSLLRLALVEGLDLLAATGGEVQACLRAGAPASRVVFHGNAKTDEELELAVEEGVGLVVVDGPEEMQRLDAVARRCGRTVGVLLRIVPEVAVQTHEAIATGHDGSRFGTSLAEAPGVLASASAMAGLQLRGVHAHIGSQILEAEPYLRAIDRAVGLLAQARGESGLTLGMLDIGGGFGVRHIDEPEIDLEGLAAGLRERLAREAVRHGLDEPLLIAEPGRWLVANAGVTLYRVIAEKMVAGRRLLAVDGGMSDNPRPALYDASYTVALASPVDPASQRATFTVVGRHCESGDVLADGVPLPSSTGVGDLLAFAATGAYTYSLASTYNRVGRPAVVAVQDGRATPWLRREDAADLERLEVGVEPASTRRMPGPVDGVAIRPARPQDAASYLRFWTAIVAERRHVRTEHVTAGTREYRRRFRRPITDREAQIVAVDGAGRLLGHVYVQREDHPVTRHVATLGIAVTADARGRGIGSALMAEAIGWARSVGVDKLMLSVYPHNRGAIALYRRFGFVEEGRLARHSRKSYGDEDEILMAVWIDGSADPDAGEAGATGGAGDGHP